MSTEQTQPINSESSEQTEALAEKLAANLRGGEVIELASDLGGGKTTFTRGLARGIGSKDHVSSPTFKIMNQYQGSTLTMYHYDFYRLSDDALIEHELQDALEDPHGVIVIEWGNKISAVPEPKVQVKITLVADNQRNLELFIPAKLSYLKI